MTRITVGMTTLKKLFGVNSNNFMSHYTTFDVFMDKRSTAVSTSSNTLLQLSGLPKLDLMATINHLVVA